MSLIGAALISGAGGLLGNIFSAKGADKQMDFQERMSNTQYQRGMKDMKAAGLNPILAYQKGGASTPSGAMPNITNPFKDVPAAVSSAISAKMMQTQLEQVQSATNLNNANSALSLEKANSERTNQIMNTATTGWTTERTRTQVHMTEQEQIRIASAVDRLNLDSLKISQEAMKAFRAEIDRKIDMSGVYEVEQWLGRIAGNPTKFITNLLKRNKRK